MKRVCEGSGNRGVRKYPTGPMNYCRACKRGPFALRQDGTIPQHNTR